MIKHILSFEIFLFLERKCWTILCQWKIDLNNPSSVNIPPIPGDWHRSHPRGFLPLSLRICICVFVFLSRKRVFNECGQASATRVRATICSGFGLLRPPRSLGSATILSCLVSLFWEIVGKGPWKEMFESAIGKENNILLRNVYFSIDIKHYIKSKLLRWNHEFTKVSQR